MTLGRFSRRLIATEFGVAVLVIVYAGLHDVSGALAGTPTPTPSEIIGSCTGPTAHCEVKTMRLNPGRYRVWTTTAADTLVVDVRPAASSAPHEAMARIASPTAARLSVGSQPPVDIVPGGRLVVPVTTAAPLTLTFEAAGTSGSTPIVVDELGVYPNAAGLLSDPRPFFGAIPPARYHSTIVPRAVVGLCAFTVVAALFLPSAPLRRLSPFVLPIVCFSLCFVDLTALFSPYLDRDLRIMYASGPLQEPAGSNLNGGLYQASRLLAGEGLTTRDGVVPWERMPGYGLFCAAAGTLFGHDTLVDLAISAVLLQTIFYCVAVGVFAWAAARVFTPAAVWGTGLVVAWLPKQLGYTQADAIVAPIALLIASAVCVRIAYARDRGTVPAGVDMAVHLAFASWFLMRPDVLPGWLAVSLILHWKNRRRLVLPLACFLAIGVAWGSYKARYTGEFSLTTTSAGASLFCGLWEVPSRFRLGAVPCTDERYFDWIQQNTSLRPQSAAANSFATREVLRFWLTYPGHVVVMLYGKMLQTVNGDVWPGYVTELQASVFRVVPRYPVVIVLLAVIATSTATGFRRWETLLLAWPLAFDAPLFWVMFASLGRFYSGVGLALVVAAIPLVFDAGFYLSIARRPWRAASILACVVMFALTAGPLYDWLLRNDALHYWTPFLDPGSSRLAGFK